MTNIQMLLSIGIPTLTVLIAILRNEQAVHALRGDFNALRGDFNALRGDFNELRSDLRADVRVLTDQTYAHGREIEALRKQG